MPPGARSFVDRGRKTYAVDAWFVSFVDRGRETYAGAAWFVSFVDRGRETDPGTAWFAVVCGPWARDVRGWRA